MKIDPLPPRSRKSKPVALVIPGRHGVEILTEHRSKRVNDHGHGEVTEILTRLGATHRCYTDTGLTQLRRSTGSAAGWTAQVWNGRAISMHLEGTKFTATSLHGGLHQSPDPMGELLTFCDWVESFDVSVATMGTMAWNLWRRSLREPVRIEFDPAISSRALYGGRKEGRPKRYRSMVSYDLSAAYPTSQAGAPYARRLYEVPASTKLTDEPGLAEATVTIPADMSVPPLPWRPVPGRDLICWIRPGIIRGVWPWRELLAARDAGAEVRVERSWAPVRPLVDLFGPWWQMVATGRELTPGAAKLAKQVANMTWGMFAMDGRSAAYHWPDGAERPGRPLRVGAQPRMPNRWLKHVAAETASRVRVRLLTEGLLPAVAPPVVVDTDGFIVRKGSPRPEPYGDGPGLWRLKQAMPVLEVKAGQLYRYTCGKGCNITHRKWHYVAAGMTSDVAEEHWNEAPDVEKGFTTTIFGDQRTLSPGDRGRARIEREIREAELAHASFGPDHPLFSEHDEDLGYKCRGCDRWVMAWHRCVA